MEIRIEQLNKNKVKQWTNDSTGYKTESSKDNSEYYGHQVKTISPTTTPNTTHQPHIED